MKYLKKFRELIDRHQIITTIVAGLFIIGGLFTMATAVPGCIRYIDSQGQEVTRLSDETTDVLDKAAELAPVVQDTLIGVGIAIPAFAGLASLLVGIIGGVTGAYKKYRPQITAEHDSAVQAGNLTKALVYAIEQFKGSNTQDWEHLKGKLRKELTDKVGPEALAVIEALIQNFYKDKSYNKETK